MAPFLPELFEQLRTRCEEVGFDLTAHCALSDYLARVPAEYAIGHGFSPDSTVLLIGHTRQLWPAFQRALAHDPTLADRPHPLDSWTVEVLREALSPLKHLTHELRFSFAPMPHRFAALKLAVACGLAEEGPAGLAAHPLFGTWFGLRAALVLPWPHRQDSAPAQVCSVCPDKPCQQALSKALKDTDAARQRGQTPDWRTWVKVRESCPIGQAYAYSEPQLRWHYAHDRRVLRPS